MYVSLVFQEIAYMLGWVFLLSSSSSSAASVHVEVEDLGGDVKVAGDGHHIVNRESINHTW